jgi:hypothetical protein
MIMYANDNRDFLPDDSGAHQTWDMVRGPGTSMASGGAPYKVWYDPGTSPAFNDTDWQAFWNNPTVEADGDLEANRIIDYSLTFSGIGLYADSGGFLFSTNVNQKLSTSVIQDDGLTMPVHVSSRVLVGCSSITPAGEMADDLPTMQTFTWSGIPHTADPDVPGTKPFTTSHLTGKVQLPSGGNDAMLDGHVEWRNFKDFNVRAGSSGSGPCFYY